MKLNPAFDAATIPPHILTRMWENEELSREEYHESMAVHAKRLIEEIDEAYRNPIVEYFERLMNQRAAKKLVARNDEALIREVFCSLAELRDFPPAIYLWNANHWRVPLHCFIRTRWEPVFRVVELRAEPLRVKIRIEYGANDRRKVSREVIEFQRSRIGTFQLRNRSLG